MKEFKVILFQLYCDRFVLIRIIFRIGIIWFEWLRFPRITNNWKSKFFIFHKHSDWFDSYCYKDSLSSIGVFFYADLSIKCQWYWDIFCMVVFRISVNFIRKTWIAWNAEKNLYFFSKTRVGAKNPKKSHSSVVEVKRSIWQNVNDISWNSIKSCLWPLNTFEIFK